MAKKIRQSPIVCWVRRVDTFCANIHARVSNQDSTLVLIDLLLALFLHFSSYWLCTLAFT